MTTALGAAHAGTVRFEGVSDELKFEDWAVGLNSNWVVKSEGDEILIARPYIGLLGYLTPRASESFDLQEGDFEFRVRLRGFQPPKHSAYIQFLVVSVGWKFSQPIMVTENDQVKLGREGKLFQIDSYPATLRFRRVGKDLLADADLSGGTSFTTLLGVQEDYFHDPAETRFAMRISARDNAVVLDSIEIIGGPGVPELNVKSEPRPATDSAQSRPTE